MKNNTLFYYLLVFFIFFTINAQLLAQDRARYPFFADYFQQQILYSPAFTGMPDQPLFMSAGRFENRFDEQKPLSLAGSVQGLIQSLGMGVGITAQYHKFDDSFTYGSQRLSTNKKLLKLMVASSYPIRIGEFEGFRMGLSIGALHYKSDEAYVQGINPQPAQLYNERFFKLDMDLGLGLQAPPEHPSQSKSGTFSIRPASLKRIWNATSIYSSNGSHGRHRCRRTGRRFRIVSRQNVSCPMHSGNFRTHSPNFSQRLMWHMIG